MGPCDIKSSAKAWNDGLEAFKKAFKQTGGKTTESLKFAINEVKSKNPDLNFDTDSFTDPIIQSLKDKKIIDEKYNFKGGKEKNSPVSKKIEKIAEKMKGLSPDQKKSFARKAYSTFEKEGVLDQESVKNIYSEAIGIPAMDEKLGDQIKKTSQALQEFKSIEKEIDSDIRALQEEKDKSEDKKLSPEKDKEFTKKFELLSERKIKARANVMKEQSAFAEMLKEKKFWLHQLTDYMPLNLMNPNSLEKNVSGAIVDGIMRSVGNTLAPPISKAASIFTNIYSNPFGAKAKGAITSEAKSKASAAWKYGQTDFNSELPKANHLNSVNRFKQAMAATGKDRFKGIVSALLKVHPDLISKGLTVPDAIVYEMTHSAEMNRIAESKGLKGAEKEAFLLKPDEKSLEIAKKLSENATFKQDLPAWMSGIKKLSSYDPHEQSKKLIEKGMSPLAAKIRTGLGNVVLKSAVPFIKTPINIVRTASKVLLPEYELAEALIQAKKEKNNPVERQRLIIEGFTKASVGFFIRNVALQMVSQGLISAGYDDEDKKSKDIIEQELGGPNRINLSAFIRGLTFRDTKKQASDVNVDLNALGAFGIVMAVYAHAFNKYSKDEIAERTGYDKSLIKSTFYPGNTWDLAWSQLSSSMDFTFFTGINQLQGAIQNKEGYEANQLATQYIANLFTGVAPSTYQKLSTQIDPNVKKQFDKDLSFRENLVNALGYRFAFQSNELKNKYFSLAEQGEGAVKKKNHMLFDNYLGRVLESEFDFGKITDNKTGDPISKLHEALKEVPKDERDKLFPSGIGKDQTIEIKKTGKKKTIKTELTDEQHDFLQNQASNYRMMLATPFIMSQDFDKADFETRTKVLQSLYSDGLKMAKKDLKDRFPEIKSQNQFNVKNNKNTVKSLSKKYHKQ